MVDINDFVTLLGEGQKLMLPRDTAPGGEPRALTLPPQSLSPGYVWALSEGVTTTPHSTSTTVVVR